MSLELLTSDVFRNALAAGALSATLAAVVGYFVVLRAQAFAAEAFLDICFAGAAGAALLGLAPLAGMAVFGLSAGLGMGALGERVREHGIEVGMVLSFALGLGVLFLSLYAHGGAARGGSGIAILFGSLVGVRPRDLLRLLIVSIVVLTGLGALYRPLLFATVDTQSAVARGVPVRLLSVGFLLVLALAAAASAQVVGVLLASSLLIAPPAAAARLTRRPARGMLLAVGLGLLVTWGGIFLSFAGLLGHPPVGSAVSGLAAVVYFLSVAAKRGGYPRVSKAIIISDSAETGLWTSKRESSKRSAPSASEAPSHDRPLPGA